MPILRKMLRRIAMTTLARDAAITEGLPGIVVAGVGKCGLHSAGMAMKTAAIDRQRQRHLGGQPILWRHVPNAFFRIPVDRDLKPIAVALKEEGPSAFAGAEKIK